jgi:nucleoid DNA-binding protein
MKPLRPKGYHSEPKKRHSRIRNSIGHKVQVPKDVCNDLEYTYKTTAISTKEQVEMLAREFKLPYKKVYELIEIFVNTMDELSNNEEAFHLLGFGFFTSLPKDVKEEAKQKYAENKKAYQERKILEQLNKMKQNREGGLW